MPSEWYFIYCCFNMWHICVGAVDVINCFPITNLYVIIVDINSLLFRNDLTFKRGPPRVVPFQSTKAHDQCSQYKRKIHIDRPTPNRDNDMQCFYKLLFRMTACHDLELGCVASLVYSTNWYLNWCYSALFVAYIDFTGRVHASVDVLYFKQDTFPTTATD